jgi:hypothetical protein
VMRCPASRWLVCGAVFPLVLPLRRLACAVDNNIHMHKHMHAFSHSLYDELSQMFSVMLSTELTVGSRRLPKLLVVMIYVDHLCWHLGGFYLLQTAPKGGWCSCCSTAGPRYSYSRFSWLRLDTLQTWSSSRPGPGRRWPIP